MAAVLLLSLPLPHALALSYLPPLQLSPPALELPSSQAFTEIKSGQQLVISTTVSHVFGDTDWDLIAFVEVRDSSGVTMHLAWQSTEVKVGGQKEIGVSWTPLRGGYYEIRTFAITNNWDSLEILSDVSSQQVKVGFSCGGNMGCFVGTVTHIVDGDTLDIGETRIRLALVNTPERGQLGYHAATEFTERTCPVGSEAVVDEDDGQLEGSFSRMIAKVYCGSEPLSLNELLLRDGLGEILLEFCDESEFRDEMWAMQYGCGSSNEDIVR